MYWATKGAGAFLKSPRYEGPLRASGTQSLRDAVVILEVGCDRSPESVSRVAGTLAAVMQRSVRTVRMAGSTGLNLAAIASGVADAVVDQGSWATDVGPKIWDFAGGKLLVEEAGGVVLDPSGGPFDLTGRSVFAAASPALAKEMLEVLREVPPSGSPSGRPV
jgi:fructose-1,6-bisphosphatase/inositol monophosphatase family enzyme